MTPVNPLPWLKRRLDILFRRDDVEAELSDEIRFHLDMEADDLMRQGRSAEEAFREARTRLGGVEQTREAVRDVSLFHRLNGLVLDFKLGLRMLRKHWGLTLLGGMAMTAAMTLGASIFHLIEARQGTNLPLEEGDRVVIVQPFDLETEQPLGSSLEDVERWRTLGSLEDVGGFRSRQHRLTTINGSAAPVTVAEMSAAGFDLARTAPFMGRALSAEDESAGAPRVVVIGYEAWQSAFAADPEIIGQQIQLDEQFYTIVGVMPPDFGFPFNFQYWTSLNPVSRDPLAVDRVTVFARLARGATLESAQAEVGRIPLSEASPNTAAGPSIRPVVVPFVEGMGGGLGTPVARFLPLFLPLLLFPPSVNIGVLIYARTVARQGEFAVRTALGASRGRIVTQIFVEMLVLAAVPAGIAIALVPKVANTLGAIVAFNGQPFWMNYGVSPGTILYAAALAAVAALATGMIPALRATGGGLPGLHALHRGSSPRLGKGWTATVMAQVALAVALVPASVELAWNNLRPIVLGPGFEIEEFLTARLDMNGGNTAGGEPRAAAAARFRSLRDQVVQRVEAEPGVTAVTTSAFKPFEERNLSVEVDLTDSRVGRGSVAFNQVDSVFFHVFEIPLLAGRGFEPRDNDPEAGTVLVNRSFASDVLEGENPLGRTVRVTGRNAAATRYEIVGLVENQFAHSGQPTIYRPLGEDGETLFVHLAIQTGPTVPVGLASRLRTITASLDPALGVDDVQPLDEIYFFLSLPGIIIGSGPAAVALGVLLFAAVGIYTQMSFAVVERRREIGIRSALGASPRRLVAGMFRSVFVPVLASATLGTVAALVLEFYLPPLLFGSAAGARPLPWILPAAEAFVFLMGLAALFGPVRRTLEVDATEALRES